MEKELTIMIAGHSNTGKSSMMYHLYQTLMQQGFEVVMNFEGHPEHDSKKDFVAEMEYYTKERLDAVKKGTMITLKEMELVREANQNINTEVKD
jgi:septin family protein